MLVYHSYHVFLSIIMDGWRVSNTVLFLQYVNGSLKQWLHWRKMFISNPKKFRRCINGDFTGFDLPKYLIYYRSTYCTHWPFSAVSLLPLKNDARIIARSNYENKFRPKLYCPDITPNYKPRIKVMFFNCINYNINTVCILICILILIQYNLSMQRLQWSLLSLITVTGCFAVFRKVATGSKNTKRFMAK